MMTSGPLLYVNCRAATLSGDAPYGLIEEAAILTEGGMIRWTGPRAAGPKGPPSTTLRAASSPPPSSTATPISSTAATAPPNSNCA